MKKLLIIVIVIIAVLTIVGIIIKHIDTARVSTENEISLSENNINEEENKGENEMYIKINDKILTATLENNSSVESLIEKLQQADITINMSDYSNFEKVGDLGFSLPTNDQRITTTPGDLILYQGNQITLYYDTNTWNFTKLGHIDVLSEELKEVLGKNDVTLTLSLVEKN